MNCPSCDSRQISKQKGTTDLGYQLFRCNAYRRKFNERTGTPFNHLKFPTDINRRIEQDHRGIKQRYYPTLGFGAFRSAQRFCSPFDEIRQYFRPRRRRKQFVSLARQRQLFVTRVQVLQASFLAS